ncbi:hypothetical protein GCM10020331_071290 [Ectobacillus funiculus]
MLNAPKQAGLDAMYSLFAEMVLEESIRKFRKEQLQKEKSITHWNMEIKKPF